MRTMHQQFQFVDKVKISASFVNNAVGSCLYHAVLLSICFGSHMRTQNTLALPVEWMKNTAVVSAPYVFGLEITDHKAGQHNKSYFFLGV